MRRRATEWDVRGWASPVGQVVVGKEAEMRLVAAPQALRWSLDVRMVIWRLWEIGRAEGRRYLGLVLRVRLGAMQGLCRAQGGNLSSSRRLMAAEMLRVTRATGLCLKFWLSLPTQLLQVAVG